jgi:hypothetical protein
MKYKGQQIIPGREIPFLYNRFIRDFCEWILLREKYGAFRFWLIRKLYKLMTSWPEKRNLTWDFVLQYLPHLKMVYWNKLKVLDVGFCDSLLIYEINRRGYAAYGLDLVDYHCRLPKEIKTFKADLLQPIPNDLLKDGPFSFIVAIGTIELIGMGKYNNDIVENGDRLALEYIHNLLEDGGYFILILPTENWRFIHGRGYSFGDILQLINGLFYIFEITHRGGNICIALVKILNEADKKGLCTTNKMRFSSERT